MLRTLFFSMYSTSLILSNMLAKSSSLSLNPVFSLSSLKQEDKSLTLTSDPQTLQSSQSLAQQTCPGGTSCKPGQKPGPWSGWSPRPACQRQTRSKCGCQNQLLWQWSWRISSQLCHRHSKISWNKTRYNFLNNKSHPPHLWRGYWCWIFFDFGSWIANPSTETVSSTLGVLVPSDFFNCWMNFNFLIPSFTTSIPLGWSTSVDPKN